MFVSTAVSSDPSAGIRTGLYGDVEPAKDVSKHAWKLVALDKRTGKVLWERVAHEGIPKTRRHPKSSQATATPVTDGQRVIVSFGSEGLYAYDVDGKPLWNRDLGVLNAGWFYDPDYEWGIGSSPIIWKNLVIGDQLYVLQINGVLAAYNVLTGERVYQERVGGGGSFSASPVAADGKLYLTSEDGDVFVVKAGATYELPATNHLGQVVMATPAISDGTIIIRGLKDVIAIKQKS